MAVKFIVDSGADILPTECEQLGIIHLPLKVMFGEKEYGKMLELTLGSRLFDEVIVTEVSGERGVSAERLIKAADNVNSAALCKSEPDFETAIGEALTKQQHLEYIYIVGSLYLVGQAKKLLSNHVKFSDERKGEQK